MNVQLTENPKIPNATLSRVVNKNGYADSKNLLQDKTLTKNLLDLTSDAVIITDNLGYIQFLNLKAKGLIDWQSSNVRSLSSSDFFEFLSETTDEILENPIQKVLEHKQTISNVNCILKFTDSHHSISVEYSAAPIYENSTHIIGVVLVLSDISDSRKLAHQLSWQLNHDSLTGLVNRYVFEESLEQAVTSAKSSGQQHVLCYLDLDQFNVINDTCGYVAGDEVLKQISALCLQRVRKTDVLARLGGDEFGLILYQCDLDQALSVIRLLREAVQQFRFKWEDKVFNFSVSIGIAILDGNIENPSHVLSMVNLACDAAKGKGRNRLHVYQTHDQDLASQRGEAQWIPRIYKALEENQFCLHSQPITPVELSSSSEVPQKHAFQEILIRLQDETGKTIFPGEFIPAAERYGLMHLLDQWVIKQLFAHIQQHGDIQSDSNQPSRRNCRYTINLSGASLNDDQFLDFVREQFEYYGIPPHLICFEITETLAIANLIKATELIHQLKALGCYFALDDFGSGMSSFGYLQQLPIDYLKIDGMFVKGLTHDSVAVEIVKSINQIAHVIGIQTVAEYVESDEILDQLKRLGIDYAQGYCIAKPSPLN